MKKTISWKPVLLPVGLCIKNGMIWFIQNSGNQLIGMDIHSFQIRKRLRIPCIPWGNGFFHRKLNDKIVDIGDKILILLNGSKTIYTYDFSSDGIDQITDLPNGKIFLDNSILYKNEILYVLPYNSNYLLKYDICNDYWEEIQIADYDVCMQKQFEIENDIILAVDNRSNIVYEYNLKKNWMEKICVGDINNHYWGITRAGEYCVMPHGNKRSVTLWKRETGEIYEIMDFPEDFGSIKEYAYLSMCRVENEVLLIPYYANMILKIDVINMKISNGLQKSCFWLDDCSDVMNDSKIAFYASIVQDKKLYLYSVIQRKWHVADIGAMNLKEFSEYEINEEDNAYIGMLFDDTGKGCFMGYESKFNCCNLNNFVLSVGNCIHDYRNIDTCSGLAIWNALHENF